MFYYFNKSIFICSLNYFDIVEVLRKTDYFVGYYGTIKFTFHGDSIKTTRNLIILLLTPKKKKKGFVNILKINKLTSLLSRVRLRNFNKLTFKSSRKVFQNNKKTKHTKQNHNSHRLTFVLTLKIQKIKYLVNT